MHVAPVQNANSIVEMHPTPTAAGVLVQSPDTSDKSPSIARRDSPLCISVVSIHQEKHLSCHEQEHGLAPSLSLRKKKNPGKVRYAPKEERTYFLCHANRVTFTKKTDGWEMQERGCVRSLGPRTHGNKFINSGTIVCECRLLAPSKASAQGFVFPPSLLGLTWFHSDSCHVWLYLKVDFLVFLLIQASCLAGRGAKPWQSFDSCSGGEWMQGNMLHPLPHTTCSQAAV